MKILVTPFAYNEGIKIKNTLSKFPRSRNYDVMVFDDGSTDGSLSEPQINLKAMNISVLRNESNFGIGAAIRKMIKYAINENYDILVIMAGNDKDDASEIDRLINPVIVGGFDFVQGSRYLPGGNFGNMPFYRQIATRYIHPLLMSLITKRRITDSTNGFRAINLNMFKDNKINIDQDWLNKYELEPYLMYKSIALGYKFTEVPVTKIYPPKALGYTKMKPITGWWSILRPLLLLGLKLKK